MALLVLDSSIRTWVLVPLFVLMLLLNILRYARVLDGWTWRVLTRLRAYLLPMMAANKKAVPQQAADACVWCGEIRTVCV
jgi:hypothetical protein